MPNKPNAQPRDKFLHENKPVNSRFNARLYLESISFILFITFIGLKWGSFLGLVNMGMLFLLPVLYSAVRWGDRGGTFSALCAIIAYDLFVVPPRFSFTVSDLRYLISFSIFLLIGAYTGKLSSRLQEQVVASRKREAQTSALYSLSREIAAVSELDYVLRSVINKIGEIAGSSVTVFLPDHNGKLVSRPDSEEFNCSEILNIAESAIKSGKPVISEKDKAVADWVYKHSEAAGKGTLNFAEARGLYLPLLSEQGVIGVIAVPLFENQEYPLAEQRSLLEAFASLTALAVNRISLMEKAQEAKLLHDSDKLRNALLNSLSHDLRTPLASVIGASSSLLEDHMIYDEQSRMDLLQTIQQGAMSMNRLVNNLLDMARLESGMLKLNKQWCDMEEIIGAALKRFEAISNERSLELRCTEILPLINVDFVLIEQVVVNLLDNALKYSNPQSKILIDLAKAGHGLTLSVSDFGIPIPEDDLDRIFDKFYRVSVPRQVSGTGLGLAISKGIVELHGGRIWAENHSGSTVSISFLLPIETVPQNTDHCIGVPEHEQ